MYFVHTQRRKSCIKITRTIMKYIFIVYSFEIVDVNIFEDKFRQSLQNLAANKKLRLILWIWNGGTTRVKN